MPLNSASPDIVPTGPHLPGMGEELISMCPEIPIFPWDRMFQVHFYLKCLESMSIRATVCSGIWHSAARLMWRPTRLPGSSPFQQTAVWGCCGAHFCRHSQPAPPGLHQPGFYPQCSSRAAPSTPPRTNLHICTGMEGCLFTYLFGFFS